MLLLPPPLRKDHAPILILSIAIVLSAIAGVRAHLAMNRHDEPASAALARDELRATIDLRPRVGCEESFDLALYTHSGVELVTWDSAATCTARHITVKYIPGRIKRAALLERIERLATFVRVE